MTQLATRTVSARQLMLRPEFSTGLLSIALGLPFNSDGFRGGALAYEYARQFAVATGESRVRMLRGRIEPRQVELLEALLRDGTFAAEAKPNSAEEIGL